MNRVETCYRRVRHLRHRRYCNSVLLLTTEYSDGHDYFQFISVRLQSNVKETTSWLTPSLAMSKLTI